MESNSTSSNNTIDIKIEEYKTCAGKGCDRIGIHLRKIIYFNKSAYFCDKCIDDLDKSGLLIDA